MPPLLSRFILGFAIFLVAGVTSADEWMAIPSSAAGKLIEIDSSSIRQGANGNTTAWSRLLLQQATFDADSQVRYSMVQALHNYDCLRRTQTPLRRVYILDGREVKTEELSSKPLSVIPDSIDERLLEAACKPLTASAARINAEMKIADSLRNNRPHPMYAEMVSIDNEKPPLSVKVADTAEHTAPAMPEPGGKKQFIQIPKIDKSKAVDPFKGAAPPAKQATTPAPDTGHAAAEPTPQAATADVAKTATASKKPAAAAAEKKPKSFKAASQLPENIVELSRKQRELMLATSGPKKYKSRSKRKKAKKPEPPPEPDYSKVHWAYAGLGAPHNWAKLSPQNAICASGKRQSPIDIRGGIKVDLEPIQFDYQNTGFRVEDNGHTIKVEVSEGNTITVTGHTYELIQLHFHRPAEERVNGRSFDMVAHLVHQDYDNNLAVVAVLMEKGADNPLIQTLWNYIPLEVGMSVAPPDAAIDLMRLLPENRDYYTYMGSLTTPPCSENVLWMVLKQPIPISYQQIGIFARLYPHNARPVQPSNQRLIKQSR